MRSTSSWRAMKPNLRVQLAQREERELLILCRHMRHTWKVKNRKLRRNGGLVVAALQGLGR